MIILILTASPALGESGTFSIGAIGGWASSITDMAIEGFPWTEFKSSGVYGGSIMYRFAKGFALELCAQHLEMELEELGVKYGTLKMTPLMLLFKLQGKPKNGTGITGHGDIGGDKLYKF